MANFRRTEIVLNLTSKQINSDDWDYWNTEYHEEVGCLSCLVGFLFAYNTVADYI